MADEREDVRYGDRLEHLFRRAAGWYMEGFHHRVFGVETPSFRTGRKPRLVRT